MLLWGVVDRVINLPGWEGPNQQKGGDMIKECKDCKKMRRDRIALCARCYIKMLKTYVIPKRKWMDWLDGFFYC